MSALVDGWPSGTKIAALERDLALAKLRSLYDTIRFDEEAGAERADEAVVAAVPVSIDLDGMLSLDADAEDVGPIAKMPEPEAVPEAGVVASVGAEAGPDPVSPEVAPEESGEPEPEAPANPESEKAPENPEPEKVSVNPEPERSANTEPEAPANSELEAAPANPEPEKSANTEPEEPAAGPRIAEPEMTEPEVTEPEAGKPAAELSGAGEPASAPAPAARPVEATLFDLEGTVSHRRRQRVILSLYGAAGPEPASKPEPKPELKPELRPEPKPESAVVPHPEPERESEPRAGAPLADEPRVPAEQSDAAPVLQPEAEVPGATEPQSVEPQSVGEPAVEAAEPEDIGSEAGPETPAPGASPVLGEVINHDVQTLADTIEPPRDMASELRRLEPVTDLERAIGLNDKFLLIRDLFGGDAAAYERAIGTLNGFDDLDDCMIYIAENYAWNPNSDGAKLLMELLERKFA